MRALRIIPVIILLLLSASPALASVVGGAKYSGIVRVTDNGTATAEGVSVNFTLNSSGLIDNNFASENLTDMAILLGGSDTAFMPSVNSTNPWVMWVSTIGAGQNIDYSLYSGNATGGKYCYFPGAGGMTTSDDAALELSDNFTVEISGYIDTTQVGQFIINKTSAFGIEIYADGVLGVDIDSIHTLEATGIPSGEHNIKVVSYAGENITIEIDDVIMDNTELKGASVPDNSNNWVTAPAAVMPYMEYLDITIDGVQQQYIAWEYDTTFTDLSGNGHDATPTFRITSSSANVSAEFLSFVPVSQARAPTFGAGDVGEILTGTPDAIAQLYTELDFTSIPGADAFNALLEEGEIPQALWWFPFIFIGITIVGLIVYQASTLRVSGGHVSEDSASTGSLLAMCIVIEVLLGIFGMMNPIPFWPALLFPIPAFALIISQKHWSWG